MQADIKIAYIGGGSKNWARVFMADLAASEGLSGEMALFDIDMEAARRNAAIGKRIYDDPSARSRFRYRVCETIEDALTGADFVIISILPGTFQQMRSDVHTPEKYGIYQSVGDTVGPGGILRAMRTVPLYEEFARKIQLCCPRAWVLNLTNPMTILVKTLYDVFPGIKAFGCCHEVFHTQNLLCQVLKELKGIDATRKDIYTDASGINHFTWITEARYGQLDILALLPEFMDRFYEEGYYEKPGQRFAFREDPFAYGNKVKLDLFRRYGALAAAGDRHLAEFLPNTWYLKDPQTVKDWAFNLTTVDYREKMLDRQLAETIALAKGEKPFLVQRSSEEAADLMKALLGFETIVSNVNLPNAGQMSQLPLGSVVETNCVFSNGCLKPVTAKPLPTAAANLVLRNCLNIDTCYEGIRARDLNIIFQSFLNQPLCGTLTPGQAEALFREMCENTQAYLTPHFDLKAYWG